jgi:hypothetical protein
MKKRFANLLRRIAKQLDPLVRAEPVTPLEFISTHDLAKEICRRNDSTIVFWVRQRVPEGDERELLGHFYWRLQPCEVNTVFKDLYSKVTNNLQQREGTQP